jgi:uncharacterized protein
MLVSDQVAPDLTRRHITLDAVRGFAVMGILAMNIVDFAMPEVAYVSPAAYGGSTGMNLVSWIFSTLLIDGKMRGLFSLLFGASMMLVIDRAVAKGENPAKVHYARMICLLVFGLIHFFLIWAGDILFSYAAIGCIAYLFRKWTPRKLIRFAVGLYIIATFLLIGGMGFSLYQQHAAQAPGASAELVKQYKEDQADSPFTPAAIAEEIKLHRGSYAEIVQNKWVKEKFSPLNGVILGLMETLPMMLIGMALLKNGFLTGEWEEARYRRVALWTIPISLFVTAIIMLVEWRSGFDGLTMVNGLLAWTGFPRLAMTIGYAALLVILIRHLSESRFIARVAATGQAAFTNYLGTSVIMTTIFYGYGLGLYGHIERAALWPFVIGAWVIMLLWAQPWLARFRYGPLEWLWRSMARRSVQPMRRG